jgi:hypothetical protein
MIVMPDGAKLDMRWKSISYIVGDQKLVFPIVPMYDSPDVVCIPNKDRFSNANELERRDELIFLIQTTAWKRELKFLEINQNPIIMEKEDSLTDKGSLEMTNAGQSLENEYLFDPQSPLTKEQVKELYLDLEKRFAEAALGDIEIIKNGYLQGSVMERITIPVLQNNMNVNISFL